jgi:hypothetical protein
MTKTSTRCRGPRREVHVLVYPVVGLGAVVEIDELGPALRGKAHHSRFVRDQKSHDQRMREPWTWDQRLPFPAKMRERLRARAIPAIAPRIDCD